MTTDNTYKVHLTAELIMTVTATDIGNAEFEARVAIAQLMRHVERTCPKVTEGHCPSAHVKFIENNGKEFSRNSYGQWIERI